MQQSDTTTAFARIFITCNAAQRWQSSAKTVQVWERATIKASGHFPVVDAKNFSSTTRIADNLKKKDIFIMYVESEGEIPALMIFGSAAREVFGH